MNTLKSLRLSPRLEIFALVAVIAIVAVLLPHTVASLPIVGFGFAGMILDAQLVLSDAQAVTVTAVSTNAFDSGAAGTDVTSGEPLCLVFTVDVAAVVTSGDETYQFQAIQSANADLSAQDVLNQTDTAYLTRALLVAGKKFFLPLPPGSKTKRYLGARYVTGGNADRAITVSCEIQPMSMLQNDYINASGFLIDS